MESLYGVLAEFDSPERLIQAVRAARGAGYRRLDAFSPYPVEGLAEALGQTTSRVPLVTLISGLAGCAGGFLMQWYALSIFFPLNVGGRPFTSWPLYLPITFELTVLAGGFGALFGMFVLNGLPKPYHPLFNVPQFDAVTRNRFFLCVEPDRDDVQAAAAKGFLRGLEPVAIYDVPERRPPLEEHA